MLNIMYNTRSSCVSLQGEHGIHRSCGLYVNVHPWAYTFKAQSSIWNLGEVVKSLGDEAHWEVLRPLMVCCPKDYGLEMA